MIIYNIDGLAFSILICIHFMQKEFLIYIYLLFDFDAD